MEKPKSKLWVLLGPAGFVTTDGCSPVAKNALLMSDEESLRALKLNKDAVALCVEDDRYLSSFLTGAIDFVPNDDHLMSRQIFDQLVAA
jgi:hypothetical protein